MSTRNFTDPAYCLTCQDRRAVVEGHCFTCYAAATGRLLAMADQCEAVGALAQAVELRTRWLRRGNLLMWTQMQGATT